MKKTINSSIGRIAFNIEEDAHQKLSAYLDAISQSLRGSAGHDEIMADIEARIAEILLQKIKGSNQVVTIAEVEEVIGVMGTPDAFAMGEEGAKKADYTNQSSGTYSNNGYKRVFRDPDDKVMFGVCSGVAHHFGIDPLWLRLAFGLSFLIGGFGLILYILLGIIIPKARTSAEKLEMRGEPADINNIKRTVEEELNDLKRRMENVKTDFQSGRYRNTGRDTGKRVGDFFSSIGHGVGSVLGGIIRGVFAFIGFILVCVFSVILIGLMISLFSGVNVIHMHVANGHWAHYSVNNLFSMFAITGGARTMLLIGIGLFVGIPLLAIIVRIGRTVMGVQNRMHALRIIFFSAWMIGLVVLLIGAFQTFSHFSVTGNAKEEIKFSTPAKTLYVTMPERENRDFSINIDSLNFYVTDDDIFQGNPSLCIQPSLDSNFHLMINKYARGVSEPEAVQSAKSIYYSFSQKDSVLKLSPFFQLAQGAGWRKQKMDVELLVPVNKAVSLPAGIDGIMCSAVHREHHQIGGHRWLMGQSGLVAKDSL